jgi:uncharacterized protein
MMTNYLIVPGLGNSGEAHWQTYFEHTLSNCKRIVQQEWDAPDCKDWMAAIDTAVSEFEPETVVLIGHSLGCTTIAHWAVQYGKKIKGSLLVAPSDVENPVYTFPATGFTPIPAVKISFTTIVVASSNDEWVTEARAKLFAADWGSNFISIGAAGHINAASGYGVWPEGLEIVNMLG